jgi:hypothetical protein
MRLNMKTLMIIQRTLVMKIAVSIIVIINK